MTSGQGNQDHRQSGAYSTSIAAEIHPSKPDGASGRRVSVASTTTSDGTNESTGSATADELNLSRYATNATGPPPLTNGTGGVTNNPLSPFPEAFSEDFEDDHVPPLPSAHRPREPPANSPMNGSFQQSYPDDVPLAPAYEPRSLSNSSGLVSPSSPPTSLSSWVQQQRTRARGRSMTDGSTSDSASPLPTVNGYTTRPQRPPVNRTPSNLYAPERRPSGLILSSLGHHRSSSASAHKRRSGNPDADYRAQKKAYEQRLRRDNQDQGPLGSAEDFSRDFEDSSEADSDIESLATADYTDDDPYGRETLLYYAAEDASPSQEDLNVPANRERLEWHSMLANVITGDVVKQEKKRLTGAGNIRGDKAASVSLWMGIRARATGRNPEVQPRHIEDQRSRIPQLIEEIIAFKIKGEAEAGKSPYQQVEAMVLDIEKCESLFPSRTAFQEAHLRAASETYNTAYGAIMSWHNTFGMINTELGILRAWVGNPELDFKKAREASDDNTLTDNSSFIDRLLKEDGLKSLWSDDKESDDEKKKTTIFSGINKVIEKARATLIENATQFSERHLPPYIEDLFTLINFPSRLVQQVIGVRLAYAKKIKDSTQQSIMIVEQMLAQFQTLLKLAVHVKDSYTATAQSAPGWEIPNCLEDNFDQVTLDALRYYFKLLGWKMSASKNTFREAELLEQEWTFLSGLGRNFVRGDVEVAEQFSKLTSKALERLTSHFEKELHRPMSEDTDTEINRRYKGILDSVRVRQRKLFRFSRLLTQTFENATEFSVTAAHGDLQEFYESLMNSGHVLVSASSEAEDNYILASPTLFNRTDAIRSLLVTCYRAEDNLEDPSNPYVLILSPQDSFVWEGRRQQIDVELPKFDMKPGKMRLVAEGTGHVLQNAILAFSQSIGFELDIAVPQRACLPTVDQQLHRIKKTAYKLSNTIMDSVEIIRKQVRTVACVRCEELVQNCFAFATEFGQRSLMYMDYNRRALNNMRLTKLALDWVSFIVDDCDAADKRTFRWAVNALEFAMLMTRGQNILSMSDADYATLRTKVSGCMSVLISHFDIMGARSAQQEMQRLRRRGKGESLEFNTEDDEECMRRKHDLLANALREVDAQREEKEGERSWLGRVLEDSSEADRSLTTLSSSATSVSMRWQQGQFIGGGTFGSVYVALNLDSGFVMAVKEIRLQDPQLIPGIAAQIRDEMGVLQILSHPNIVSYYGIEVHRDKVYIFMEYCSGGSLANLLEHGRIEDETVISVYALQMLEGLAYLHERGVIHRDIKPENILLDHNGVIKFVDFGAAKVIAKKSGRTLASENGPTPLQRQGRQRSMTGTPMYMAPEAIKGSSASAKAADESSIRPGSVDIWSLGCVVLEMSTGRRPWSTQDNEWAIMYNIAQGNRPQLPSKDQLSEAGIDFLKKCFEPDPSKRATAPELLQHNWMMRLRNQLNMDPQTPPSESSGASSRTNTGLSMN